MVYTFRSAHSHLEMQLNDIIIVSVMVSDAYTITNTDPIPTKIANTDLSIWYRCIPNGIGDWLQMICLEKETIM